MFAVSQTAPLDANAGVRQDIRIDASRNLMAAEQQEKRKIEQGFASPLTIIALIAIGLAIWKLLKG
jgi:hypothetical protein